MDRNNLFFRLRPDIYLCMNYQIAKEYFDYIPETGIIIRKKSTMRSNGRPFSYKIGKKCGTKKTNQYLTTTISHDGITYIILLHRLAWLLVTGNMPIR